MNSGMRICFYDKDEHRICIPLNILTKRLPVPRGDPAKQQPTEPSPWRVFEHQSIQPEIIEDLAKLAALDKLAATLSPDRAKLVQQPFDRRSRAVYLM